MPISIRLGAGHRQSRTTAKRARIFEQSAVKQIDCDPGCPKCVASEPSHNPRLQRAADDPAGHGDPMAKTNTDIVLRHHHELWSGGNIDSIGDYYAPDFVLPPSK